MNARVLVGVLVASSAMGQQLQWQIPAPPSAHQYYWVAPYGDYDSDGRRDLLVSLHLNQMQPNNTLAHRIVSGVNGATLWQRADLSAGLMVDGGDIDGDGVHDVVMKHGTVPGGFAIMAWSVRAGYSLWTVADWGWGFGDAMLGNIDLDGDQRSDFVTCTLSTLGSDIFAYDHRGQLRYTIPCFSQGRAASSFANMGDMDADGGDDFVVGCQDVTARGLVMLVSGRTGTILRTSYGLLPGDNIANHASNLGDIDGDGVNDYAGFPWWSASRAMITAFSGQTGALLRTWPEFANSVITGEDVDLDGVPDLVLGADYPVAFNVYGRTLAFSGRDGSELWRVDNFQPAPGSGVSNGSSGWMDAAGSLGVPVGEHYPMIAWWDREWIMQGTLRGRVRAYGTARAAQGPITGTACSSTPQLPLIGVRETLAGARVTIAKAPPGAFAWLNLSLANQTSYAGIPLPLDLTAFGFHGCCIEVGPTVSATAVLGTTGIDRGYAAIDFPFHLTTSQAGLLLAAQWIALDPATLGHAFTARHVLRGQ